MNLAVLGSVLLGGVAAIDAVPLGQTMLSQPLVTATQLRVAVAGLTTSDTYGPESPAFS